MLQDSTILLYTYSDILEANLVQEKLKEQGIDSFIENEDVAGLNPLGGIKVKIFSKDKEAAEKVINE
jgi:Putative prokaryotic signal transducing protein